MPTYTVHYSNSLDGPPIGDIPTIKVSSLEEAIRFAEDNFSSPSHQPSVGDMKGYCICDEYKRVVVPWREGGQPQNQHPS